MHKRAGEIKRTANWLVLVVYLGPDITRFVRQLKRSEANEKRLREFAAKNGIELLN